MWLETDVVVIFFGTQIALEKAESPVDTSHSFPLTWTLGMASKSGECTRGGRQVIKGQL
jgi:hypothetical protein